MVAYEFLAGRTEAPERMPATSLRGRARALRGIRCGQLLLALAVAVFATSAAGQNPPDPPASDETADANDPAGIQPITPGPMIAVHGVVRNAVSGEPLPRTLVQVDGETGPGTLTDGDGKFDLTLAGLGSHVFQLTKPGFHDLPPNTSGGGAVLENTNSVTHNIFVTADMGGLSFGMTPTSAIHGHIDLSTGEVAQGLGVMLLRRSLQGGHACWQVASNTRTTSDGDYRFGGLDDGDYAIETEPAKESDDPGFAIETSGAAKIASSGYAATYFPDARDFSGATKIHLRGGESAQANLILKLEPFQSVRATLPARRKEKTRGDQGVVDESDVLDSQGHRLSYPEQFDGESRTVQALLPDGTYTLRVTELQVTEVKGPRLRLASGRNNDGTIWQGTVDFTVAGHPLTNLRLPLAERVAAPVAVNVTRNAARPVAATTSGEAEVSIAVTQASDARVEGMWNQLAQGSVPGELETSPLPAGSYWVHTTINSSGLCESSFTAGSSSLAREPLVVGASGATAPLSLTLRDDCASLKLTLPANLMNPSTGEEPAFTVYVVPDFDSTVDISALVLRPSSGGTFTVENLTPGNYHVYAFDAPVELEYRNPEALASLANAGQAVTLEPLATSTLVVEEPPR
jgi:hypothetical protein